MKSKQPTEKALALNMPTDFWSSVFLFARVFRGKLWPKGLPRRDTRPGGQSAMELRSSAFENNRMIPKKYTCDDQDINPPLEISGVPAEAQSLVLIIHDSDAPVEGGWTHWILMDVDPGTAEIAEDSVPAGAIQGRTSFGKPGYGGPCPPSGIHHYGFRLYALDTRLMLDENAKKIDVEHGMEGHIIEQTTLVGLYQRAY